MKKTNLFAICFLFLFLLPNFVQARIPNFQTVKTTILRGGRPSPNDLDYLKRQGIKTIISLEVQSTVKRERLNVQKRGMHFISIPLSVYKDPADYEVDILLDHLNNPELYPIFIHCRHGEDRTGMVIGLYRVESQHWNPRDAYKEMLKLGFHPKYKPLDDYFRERTRN